MSYPAVIRDKLGSAKLRPSGAVEAGSFVSLELVYTAGVFGIDDTGGLKVVHRFATDMATPQFEDPAAPDYVSVEASNGAVLDYGFDVKRHRRPWGKTLHVKVVRGFLREGDRITVRYGDGRQGSPGIRMQTFCEGAFEFKVLVDAWATYDFIELPESPSLAITPGPPARWQAVLPTVRRVDEPFRLGIKAEDRWGNPSDRIDATVRLRPSIPVANLPETVTFRPGRCAVVLEDLRVGVEGDVVVDVLDEGGERLAASNPLRVVRSAELVPYWADLHGQSAETIGTNSAEDYFAFARDRAFLDVCSHQGNDFQVTGEFWHHLQTLTGRFNETGRFVALPGYEWSGNTGLGGDHNVLFRGEGRQIHRSSHALIDDTSDVATDCHTIGALLAALEQDGAEDVVVIAHVGGRYADLSADGNRSLVRSVEIHSAWGTFEWLLNDALMQGRRVGVVANSDDHKGRPGASYPGASLFGSYGGLTCLLCEDLTRDAVFESLRRRRHYATTGTRIWLDVRVELAVPGRRIDDDEPTSAASPEVTEALMGDVVQARAQEARLRVDVLGSAPIERVEIRNGLETVAVHRPYGSDQLGRRIRVIWEGSEYRGRGRQTTWDGAATLSGNVFKRLQAINFWNPDARLAQSGPARVSWRAATTGNFGGFDAWLGDGRAGTLAIDTPLVREDIAIADIGFDDTVFEAGGLGRRLRVFRLPDDNPHRSARLDCAIDLHPDADNPVYVCVTQEDGHRAWSSPIYLVSD